MLVRSGSGKEGAAAACLLPGRVTFPSQAGMCSSCGAPLLLWRAGAFSSQLSTDSQRQGSTGGPSSSLLPDLFSSTLSRAGNALLSRGVPGQCRASVAGCELLADEMCSGAGEMCHRSWCWRGRGWRCALGWSIGSVLLPRADTDSYAYIRPLTL